MLPTSVVHRRGPRELWALDSRPCGCWSVSLATIFAHRRASPTGPRNPASYTFRAGFDVASRQHRCSQDRSRTDKLSSQSDEGARPLEGRNRADTRSELVLVASNGLAPTSGVCHADWVDGADSSFQRRNAKSTIYMACIGCQLAHALAASRLALKRRSGMAAVMRPIGGPGVHDAVLWRSQIPWPP